MYLHTGKTDVPWINKNKLRHLDEGPGRINHGPLHWCYAVAWSLKVSLDLLLLFWCPSVNSVAIVGGASLSRLYQLMNVIEPLAVRPQFPLTKKTSFLSSGCFVRLLPFSDNPNSLRPLLPSTPSHQSAIPDPHSTHHKALPNLHRSWASDPHHDGSHQHCKHHPNWPAIPV